MSWSSSLTDLEGGKYSELVPTNYVTKEVHSKDMISRCLLASFTGWLRR